LIHFKDYEQFHRTPGNKKTHVIGIPLVLLSLLGLLAQVVLWSPSPDFIFPIDLGSLLFLFGAVYSLRVDWKLGIPFSLSVLLSYLVARHLSVPVLWTLQALGWFFQLWGHYRYEKKSPAFLTSLEHLFIGPMWIFAWLIGYYKAP
jgi:uncharacterized membrane protein YGL010W